MATTASITRTPTTRSTRSTRRLLAVMMGLFVLVSACGGNADAEPTRAYTVELDIVDDEDRYRFRIADGQSPDFTVGDEVTFAVTNTGHLNHDMRVIDPDGATLAVAPAVVPGDGFDLTVVLADPGIYQLNCVVDDHLTAHQMQVLIEVGAA